MPQWIDLSSHNASLRVEQHSNGGRSLVLLLNEAVPESSIASLGFAKDQRGLLVRADKKVSLGEIRKIFPEASARDMAADEIVFTYTAPDVAFSALTAGDPSAPSFVRLATFLEEATTHTVGAHEHVVWRSQRYPTEIAKDPQRALRWVHQEAVALSIRRAAHSSGPDAWPGPSLAVAIDYPHLVYGRGAVVPTPSSQADHNITRLLKELGVVEYLMSNAEDAHLVVKNEPYMDLVIERLPYGPAGRDALYFTHYRDINFDRVMDAEMVFVVKGHRLHLVETATLNFLRGGEIRGCDRGFAATFSRNLIEQGFGQGTVVYDNAPEPVEREVAAPLADEKAQGAPIDDHQLDQLAGKAVGVNPIGEIVTENVVGVRERHPISGHAVAQRVADDRLFIASTENASALRAGETVAGRVVEAVHPLTGTLLASQISHGALAGEPSASATWELVAFDRAKGEWMISGGAAFADRPTRSMLIAAWSGRRQASNDATPQLDVQGFIDHVNACALEGDPVIPRGDDEEGGIELERTEFGYVVTCADRRIPYRVDLEWSVHGYLPSLTAGSAEIPITRRARCDLEQAVRWAALELASIRDEYLFTLHADALGEPRIAVSEDLLETLANRAQRGDLASALGNYVADPEGRFIDEPLPWERVHVEDVESDSRPHGGRSLRITFMGDAPEARPSFVVIGHTPKHSVAPSNESSKRAIGLGIRQLWRESLLREAFARHPSYEGVAKAAHAYAQALHRAEPGAQAMPGRQHWAFAKALILRDYEVLESRLAKPQGTNEATKAFFEAFTGLRLADTPKAIAAQLAEWAGIEPAHVVIQNRRRLAELEFHGPGRMIEDLVDRAGKARSATLSAALGVEGQPLSVKAAVAAALQAGWRPEPFGTQLRKDGQRPVLLSALERDYAFHAMRIAASSAPELRDEPAPATALR